MGKALIIASSLNLTSLFFILALLTVQVYLL